MRNLFCMLFFALCALHVNAQSSISVRAQERVAILRVVNDLSSEFCERVEQSGKNYRVTISAEANAQAKLFFARLASLGIKGAVSVTESAYTNALQSDLPRLIEDRNRCRKEYFDRVKDILFSEKPVITGSSMTLGSMRTESTYPDGTKCVDIHELGRMETVCAPPK
jgi:urease gamma subunit